MEVHTHNNCKQISIFINNKAKKFQILLEENIALHAAIAEEQETIKKLKTVILQLYNIITAKRNINWELYNQEKFGHQQPVLRLTFNIDSEETETFNTNLSMIKYKNEYYGDEQIQTATNLCLAEIFKQFNNIYEHISIILHMCIMYQSELLKLKIETTENDTNLAKLINMVNSNNERCIALTKKEISVKTREEIHEKTGAYLKSLMNEIKKRNNLIKILNNQQEHLKLYMKEYKHAACVEEKKLMTINNDLKRQLERTRKNYKVLQQRRVFDKEGYQTDINELSKDLKKLKSNIYTKCFKLQKDSTY